jgi:cytochrome c
MLAKYGCVACHAVDKKSVGPAFKDVAAKYHAQTGATTHLATQVKNGGVGVWGMVPMPPHTDVPNTDLDAMIGWILTANDGK